MNILRDCITFIRKPAVKKKLKAGGWTHWMTGELLLLQMTRGPWDVVPFRLDPFKRYLQGHRVLKNNY